MSDKTKYFSLARTVRFVMAFIVTLVFGGLLMHQATTVRAAGAPVTYVLHAVDTYGNPIDAPFNQKTVVDDSSAAIKIDVSGLVTTSLDNGRYTLAGYHTDNKSDQQVMYYNNLPRGTTPITDSLKGIDVDRPERNENNKTVNLYFAYQDTQSKKPREITLSADALNREAGKVKFFFTDASGNELSAPLKYDFKDVPSLKDTFQDDIGNYRYTAAVVRNPNNYGTYVYANSKIFADMKTNASDVLWQAILQPAYMNGFSKGPKVKWESGSTVTFVYEKIKNTLTIEYIDESGTAIPGHPAQKQTLANGAEYTEAAPDIAGYTVVGDSQATGRLTEDATIKFTYRKTVTPPTPGTDTNSNSGTGQIISNPTPETTEPGQPEPETTTSEAAEVPNTAVKRGAAVYATKHIYMYQNATFNKKQRIANYPKAKRINRPMFVVTDYAHSKAGLLRYKVRDVNHKSKTAGKTGYITADRAFVVNVYYATMPKNKQITVIAKKGVNAYRNANLTKKAKNYKQGTRLKVKKIVRHNLTSRYQLSNGNYITGNKKLVIQGND